MRYLKLLIAALGLAAGSAWSGPFEDAAAAYGLQDHVTALRLCRPLAEQGEANARGSDLWRKSAVRLLALQSMRNRRR